MKQKSIRFSFCCPFRVFKKGDYDSSLYAIIMAKKFWFDGLPNFNNTILQKKNLFANSDRAQWLIMEKTNFNGLGSRWKTTI